MSFVSPQFSRSEVNAAGDLLARRAEEPYNFLSHEWLQAEEIFNNWRGSHAYPINTFQATLRSRLKQVDREAIVAQRLKRTPSIIAKLQRFDSMQLARMQDIGGLRAIVNTTQQLDELVNLYSRDNLTHKRINTKDYIACPKEDGYRSIHLVYKYRNSKHKVYDGLSIELQIRTRLQHAWATAVETMGTYLGEALKSGKGDHDWRTFFRIASAAIAFTEEKPRGPDFQSSDESAVTQRLRSLEKKLGVLNLLRGFAIATDGIISSGSSSSTYHLIVLNSLDKSVTIRGFPRDQLEEAAKAYTEVEQRSESEKKLEAVLVSAGPIDALRKAYPNYFLDTQAFIAYVESLLK